MKVFEVNEYITLKLEKNQTVIFVDEKRFNQCTFILLNCKINELEDLLALESVDELASKLDRSMEYERSFIEISPEVEFWAHCSNLQMWVENDYDTQLLHSNLAFPLLKKLTETGDKKALKVFKEEIAKRLESRYPSVVAYLVKENYINYLPLEHVIDFIVDKELFKIVTSEGFEFDFSNYLDNIGEKYSHVIKNKIIDLIQNKQLDDLIFAKESGLLEGLNKEDMQYLIENPDINIINKIIEALKDSEKYDYYYQDGFLFHDKVIDYVAHLISKKLAEIIKRNNQEEMNVIIRLELLMYVNIDDQIILIQDSETRLIEMILNLHRNELFIWFQKFFERVGENASFSIRNYIRKSIKENNFNNLKYILEESLLNNLKKEDLIYLIEAIEPSLIETIIKISRDLNPRESYFLYGSPFTSKLLNYGCKSIKEKLIEIIEAFDDSDFIAMIRLRLIQCFNVDELTILLHRPEINLLECLLKVKAYFFEDVEDWVQSFFKEMGNSISSSVKNMITNYIEMDDLEELSNFFDFEIISYLNENDKKDLCQFLKTNENYYQKRSSFERVYFIKILEQIS